MHGDLNFCARCGAPLAPRQESSYTVMACTNPACGRINYRNAKPCAGVFLEHDGRLLLVQRAIAPYKGDWDIPGGFLQEWEHPADGARRETHEETGLEIELTALLGIFVDRYGDADFNTLNIYYRARVLGGVLRPADDAERLEWFAPGALPANIAFPGHQHHVLALWREAIARDPHPRREPGLDAFVAPSALKIPV